MKLTDEEIIKLADDCSQNCASDKDVAIAFAKALEAEWLKVDMEPAAWRNNTDESDIISHEPLWLPSWTPLYTAAQLAAAREQGRKEGLENVARYLSESGYGELVEYVRAMKGE